MGKRFVFNHMIAIIIITIMTGFVVMPSEAYSETLTNHIYDKESFFGDGTIASFESMISDYPIFVAVVPTFDDFDIFDMNTIYRTVNLDEITVFVVPISGEEPELLYGKKFEDFLTEERRSEIISKNFSGSKDAKELSDSIKNAIEEIQNEMDGYYSAAANGVILGIVIFAVIVLVVSLVSGVDMGISFGEILAFVIVFVIVTVAFFTLTFILVSIWDF